MKSLTLIFHRFPPTHTGMLIFHFFFPLTPRESSSFINVLPCNTSHKGCNEQEAHEHDTCSYTERYGTVLTGGPLGPISPSSP